MAKLNVTDREITFKVVYYGPALSGKTCCLQYVHAATDPDKKQKLFSLNTSGDRTLFFDLLPFRLGTINSFQIRMQLYTVPGQVEYDLTRRAVLQGADAIVFVADSQTSQQAANAQSLENLKQNLAANKLDLTKLPLILHFNKRDLKGIDSLEDMNRALNPQGWPVYASVATTGYGVIEGLIGITQRMLVHHVGSLRLKEGPQAVAEINKLVEETLAPFAKKAPSKPVPAPQPAGPAPKTKPTAPPPAGKALGAEEMIEKAVQSSMEIANLYSELNEVKLQIERKVKELEALHEIGRAITTTLDLGKILKLILKTALENLGTRFGSVLMYDKGGRSFREPITQGFTKDPLNTVLGPDLIALSRSENPVKVNVDHDNLFPEIMTLSDWVSPLEANGVVSLMCAPLRSHKKSYGLLVAYARSDRDPFSDADLRFFSSLASQASVAVENVTLVRQVQGEDKAGVPGEQAPASEAPASAAR